MINCLDAVHYFVFCEALTRIAGRPTNLDGVVAHGNTDVRILRYPPRLAGVPDEVWRPTLAETQPAMSASVEARVD